MDLLQDLLKIQHEQTLQKVADKLLYDNFDKQTFCKRYNKSNYCLVKIGNITMKSLDCVKIDMLLSTLEL